MGKKNDVPFVAFYDMRAVKFVLPDKMADVSIAGLPAHITQLKERSTWKLEVVGSIPEQVNLTIINCLSDETLNRGPVWRCYTPST